MNNENRAIPYKTWTYYGADIKNIKKLNIQ